MGIGSNRGGQPLFLPVQPEGRLQFSLGDIPITAFKRQLASFKPKIDDIEPKGLAQANSDIINAYENVGNNITRLLNEMESEVIKTGDFSIYYEQENKKKGGDNKFFQLEQAYNKKNKIKTALSQIEKEKDAHYQQRNNLDNVWLTGEDTAMIQSQGIYVPEYINAKNYDGLTVKSQRTNKDQQLEGQFARVNWMKDGTPIVESSTSKYNYNYKDKAIAEIDKLFQETKGQNRSNDEYIKNIDGSFKLTTINNNGQQVVKEVTDANGKKSYVSLTANDGAVVAYLAKNGYTTNEPELLALVDNIYNQLSETAKLDLAHQFDKKNDINYKPELIKTLIDNKKDIEIEYRNSLKTLTLNGKSTISKTNEDGIKEEVNLTSEDINRYYFEDYDMMYKKMTNSFDFTKSEDRIGYNNMVKKYIRDLAISKYEQNVSTKYTESIDEFWDLNKLQRGGSGNDATEPKVNFWGAISSGSYFDKTKELQKLLIPVFENGKLIGTEDYEARTVSASSYEEVPKLNKDYGYNNSQKENGTSTDLLTSEFNNGSFIIKTNGNVLNIKGKQAGTVELLEFGTDIIEAPKRKKDPETGKLINDYEVDNKGNLVIEKYITATVLVNKDNSDLIEDIQIPEAKLKKDDEDKIVTTVDGIKKVNYSKAKESSFIWESDDTFDEIPDILKNTFGVKDVYEKVSKTRDNGSKYYEMQPVSSSPDAEGSYHAIEVLIPIPEAWYLQGKGNDVANHYNTQLLSNPKNQNIVNLILDK